MKLITNLKESANLLLINIFGKTLTFKQNQKTGKKFEKYNKNVALNFPHIVNL